MYAGLARLITREMKDAGFEATQMGSGVIVSLNRQLSITEVKEALNVIYPQIEFKITKLNFNLVMIEEE